MARWEAALIITIGLGLGLAIAATALLPLSHALNGGLPYVPASPFAAILGVTALLALLGPHAANPATRCAPGRSRRSGRESRPPVGTWQLASVPARAANLLFILIR